MYNPGTKTRILYAALRLFAANGVENVSMRELAEAAGIKAGSIYNHYTTKEQIVDACYDFFLQHYSVGRLNQEEYLPILEKGPKEEVLHIPEGQVPDDKAENLAYAMIIVVTRIHADIKALDTYTKMVDGSLQFLEEFFTTGIRIGRFKDFNVRGVSMIFLGIRLFASQSVAIMPKEIQDSGKAQLEMLSELEKLIPFQR